MPYHTNIARQVIYASSNLRFLSSNLHSIKLEPKVPDV